MRVENVKNLQSKVPKKVKEEESDDDDDNKKKITNQNVISLATY